MWSAGRSPASSPPRCSRMSWSPPTRSTSPRPTPKSWCASTGRRSARRRFGWPRSSPGRARRSASVSRSPARPSSPSGCATSLPASFRRSRVGGPRAMPAFLRRWVALDGHEAELRQELSFIHQTYTRKSPHVMESLMYREHFLGSEFIGLVVYADAGLGTTERRQALARLDEVAAAHARFSTPSLRVELIAAVVTSPHAPPYGGAGRGRDEMKLCQFYLPGKGTRVGVVDGDHVVDITSGRAGVGSVRELIETCETAERIERRARRLLAGARTRVGWRELDRAPSPRRAHLLAPLDPPEVWGAGITYRRSMQYYEAHTDEGGRTKGIYDHVYESERPELFFKATASRTVGPNGAIGIRRDSALTAVEPELAVIVGGRGRIVGYTVGNDLSAWDIERANPLFLPQSKIFAGCFAMGPVRSATWAGACPSRWTRTPSQGSATRSRRSPIASARSSCSSPRRAG